MSVTWLGKWLSILLALLTAGCGAADKEPTSGLAATPAGVVGEPSALVLGDGDVPAGPSSPAGQASAAAPVAEVDPPTPSASRSDLAVDAPVAEVDPVVAPTETPRATPAPPAPPTPPPVEVMTTPTAVSKPSSPAPLTELYEAAQNSPFHQFGDDVYTWDGEGRVVVLAVPVSHPAMKALREHRDGSIVDTPESRSWVQQCVRLHADQAREAPAAVYGAVTAQSVYSCLGGLVQLSELLARYWWAEAGLNCLADAVTVHSLHGDAKPRPLSVCPSIGYDPTAPRLPGWLAQRCAEIVAASPIRNHPTDPARSGELLPSCWDPVIEIVQAHAAERVEIGLPDSPHSCYHAFLGYVWARQTGRESRPPNDLAIGCQYHAFEAIP